jgi:hypothetical protein
MDHILGLRISKIETDYGVTAGCWQCTHVIPVGSRPSQILDFLNAV